MYELMLYNLNSFGKFRLFQIESCNGIDTLPFDDDINEIIDFLNAKEYKYFNNYINLRNAKRINKHFFDDKMPLQDIECLDEKYNITYTTTPFDLKVIEIDGFPNLGIVHMDRGEDRTIFEDITLDSNLGSNLVSFYAHELVHTQVEKNIYELLENYFDREFLSIFIELVISSHCNSEYNHNTIEIRHEILKEQLEKYKNKKLDKVLRSYIVSSFKAFHLYNYYINSSTEIKKEILNDVERIFKEEITVGTLLNKYEIDYDNSKKIKYLKR